MILLNNKEKLSLEQSPSDRLRKAATKVYSVVHLTCEAAKLVQLARYLSGRARAPAPALAALGLTLREAAAAAPEPDDHSWADLRRSLLAGDFGQVSSRLGALRPFDTSTDKGVRRPQERRGDVPDGGRATAARRGVRRLRGAVPALVGQPRGRARRRAAAAAAAARKTQIRRRSERHNCISARLDPGALFLAARRTRRALEKQVPHMFANLENTNRATGVRVSFNLNRYFYI